MIPNMMVDEMHVYQGDIPISVGYDHTGDGYMPGTWSCLVVWPTKRGIFLTSVKNHYKAVNRKVWQ